MEAISNLKNHSAKSVLAVLFLSVSSDLVAQVQQSAGLKDFKITIEKTESGVKMQSVKGSAWMDLSFTVDNNKPQAIDEYGMTKLDGVFPTQDANLANFLFTITKTEKGILLKGLEGTAWTELSFTLAQNGKQTIDQLGMIR